MDKGKFDLDNSWRKSFIITHLIELSIPQTFDGVWAFGCDACDWIEVKKNLLKEIVIAIVEKSCDGFNWQCLDGMRETIIRELKTEHELSILTNFNCLITISMFCKS